MRVCLSECAVVGCDRPLCQRGYCRSHYMRWYRHGDPLGGRQPRPASCSECEQAVWARGRCRRHYQEWWERNMPPCSIADCVTKARSKGLCPRHYQRMRKYGDPLAGPAFRRKRGEGLPRWAYWQRRDDQRLAADPDLIEYVAVLYRDPCAYCGEPCEHIDHIVPVDSGGGLVVENVTASCGGCNVRKHTTPLLAFLLARGTS
jgi:hypothetical protein